MKKSEYQEKIKDYPSTVINMHVPNAINIYEQVHHEWNKRIDEVISEYGNKSLAEKELEWNILNAVQHNVRRKKITDKISPIRIDLTNIINTHL